jgi:hypothetical protein
MMQSPGPESGVLAPVRPTFRAVAVTVVPEAARLDAAGWRAVEAIVERALAARPRKLQRQLVLFLRVIAVRAVLRHGRPFHRMDAAARQRMLAALEDSRSPLLRRGFWGLRTLILMGYYGRPGAAAEIGYAADPRGWEARR